MKLQSECLPELQSSAGLTRAEGSTPMLAEGHQFPADYWQEDSFPHHMYLSLHRAARVASQYSQTPPSDLRQTARRKPTMSSYDLVLDVTHHHFCSILMIEMSH